MKKYGFIMFMILFIFLLFACNNEEVMEYEVVLLDTYNYKEIPVNILNFIWASPGQELFLNEDFITEIKMGEIIGGHKEAQDKIINITSMDTDNKIGINTEKGSTIKNNYTAGGDYNSGYFADYAHLANYKIVVGYTYPIYTDTSIGQPEFFIAIEPSDLRVDLVKVESYQPVPEDN